MGEIPFKSLLAEISVWMVLSLGFQAAFVSVAMLTTAQNYPHETL